MVTSFVAYPSQPTEIGATIRSCLSVLSEKHPTDEFHGWEENDIAGRFIAEPILSEIAAADSVIADITRLNFNVTYEIGFAIGKQRRALLIKNGALNADDALIREVGIFDTLGYKTYNTSQHLASFLAGVKSLTPLRIDSEDTSKKSPLYVCLPKTKTDPEIQLLSRMKKARIPFRSFDPEEHGRLSAGDAIKNVAMSHGVIVPLLPAVRKEAEVHNMRAAFVAGLAAGMEKHLLLIQFGDDPVPLDYRDFAERATTELRIEELIAEFAPEVSARVYAESAAPPDRATTLLQKLSFGASSAENEMEQLPSYYLEKEEFRRVSRGEAQIVTGRKGSGKTALFVRLRNGLRRTKHTVVLDLRPEGFQLLKFKDVILKYLEQGTKEHTVTAFWEYLLYLEICHKLIETDRDAHVRNHNLYDPYRALVAAYGEDKYVTEGDFAERMLKLMDRLVSDFSGVIGTGEWASRLSSGELTSILYQHDAIALRDKIADYLQKKNGVWVLFDNIDKGWPAKGIGPDDALIIRGLLDAIWKLTKFLRKRNIKCNGVVFLRNDVYEILIEHTPDRGKMARVVLDWTDPDLLRELIRLRVITIGNGFGPLTPFEQVWQDICVSHIGSEESSAYMIDRCLMRPRSLIDFLQYCRSHALNLSHTKIERSDIEKGEEAYSSELLWNFGLEIRDVLPEAGEVFYEFMGLNKQITFGDVTSALERSKINPDRHDELIDLLLWYGILGIVRNNGEVAYIYNVMYDKKRLKALLKPDSEAPVFAINPAFWAALEIN